MWVGKEMARVVGGDLARFHAAGPLPFFAAYLDVCIDNPTACPHPLPAGLASEVRRLASAGSGSVVVRAEHLAAADDDGLTSLLQPLRQWVKTPLHPDVSSDLVRAAAAQQKRGAVSRAQQLRDLDLALHPRLHAQAVRLPSSSGPPLSASPTR